MCLGVLVFLFYSTNKWKTESGNWMQNQALWEWELIRHRWNFILTQRVPGSPWTESPCSTSTVWQSVLHVQPLLMTKLTAPHWDKQDAWRHRKHAAWLTKSCRPNKAEPGLHLSIKSMEREKQEQPSRLSSLISNVQQTHIRRLTRQLTNCIRHTTGSRKK